MHYVIAYDISGDARRGRVASFLEGWGRRVQKSVFECELDPQGLKQVCTRLEELLDTGEDRCHIYRMCGECAPRRLVLGSDLEEQAAEVVVI